MRRRPPQFTYAGEMIDHGVVILCAEKAGRKDHRMERNVVFRHELKQFDLEGTHMMRAVAGVRDSLTTFSVGFHHCSQSLV